MAQVERRIDPIGRGHDPRARVVDRIVIEVPVEDFPIDVDGEPEVLVARVALGRAGGIVRAIEREVDQERDAVDAARRAAVLGTRPGSGPRIG